MKVFVTGVCGQLGHDVMNDLAGNNIAVSVKQKLAMRAGETDKAITVDLPEVCEIGTAIGRNLKHIGNHGPEFRFIKYCIHRRLSFDL